MTQTDAGAFFQYETLPLELVLVDESGEPVEGILDDVNSVVVSIDQPEAAHIDLTGSQLSLDPGASTIRTVLTQEQTAGFERARIGRCCNDTAHVQVNILYLDGKRLPTLKADLEVLDNLYKRVMR